MAKLSFLTVFSFLLLFFTPITSNAQTCAEPGNFEAAAYNAQKADYQWGADEDALYYLIEIEINNNLYLSAELSGSATFFTTGFNPVLKHNDLVHAKLTKFCKEGGVAETTFDFIIITDIVIYMTGNPHDGQRNEVEPVVAINDNLIPDGSVCGVCDPGFFRLNSGFYAPYGMAIDPALGYTIEQVRFKKSELCDCLGNAVDEGYLDLSGGPGPNYAGEPFSCKLTPYIFEKVDCVPGTKNGEERNWTDQTETKTMAIPNPITDWATILFQLPETSTVQLNIYDITGRLVLKMNSLSLEAGPQQLQFSAEDWPTGLFIAHLQYGTSEQVIRMIKN